MKKLYLLVFILALFCAGCGKKQERPPEENKVTIYKTGTVLIEENNSQDSTETDIGDVNIGPEEVNFGPEKSF